MTTVDDPTPAVETDVVATPVGVRVKAHPGLCQGWGLCHRFAPDVYPLDEEGLLAIHLVEVGPEQADAARRGASVCPQRAISILEIDTP